MRTIKMNRALLILFLAVVHSVTTKFVEIELTTKTNLAKHKIERRHHRHHRRPKPHYSLHKIDQSNHMVAALKEMADIPELADTLPDAVKKQDKYYGGNQYNNMNGFISKYPTQNKASEYMMSRRKNNDYVKVFHVYGDHHHSDTRRRFSMKEAQDGLSSQERNHPGNSLFYLEGNPLLGAAKFPKRKPDDHSVYGNLQTLGLINVEKLLKEARDKNRPRARPPDASKQPQLLFDRNHPGMSLMHPNEKFILGYAKFSKPVESSHRVYGNDYNIGFRSQDRSRPRRFQNSGFRRNFNRQNRRKRLARPSTYNPESSNLYSRRMYGGWSPQFSRTRYRGLRERVVNVPKDLSYKSLVLRSGENNDSPPWRLPLMIPIKLPTRQQQQEAQMKMQLKPDRKKPNKLFLNVHEAKKKFLRNSQTIPPWVKVIEKDSTELEKSKPKIEIPADKLVYGHADNFGIRYGNQPYRVLYSNFRKHKTIPGKKKNLRSGKKASRLRNGQTIPPWVQVIEKQSNEQEKTKTEIPDDKLVYGHFDNLGIRYGNAPYRLPYSNSRRSRKHHVWPEAIPEPKDKAKGKNKNKEKRLFLRSGNQGSIRNPAFVNNNGNDDNSYFRDADNSPGDIGHAESRRNHKRILPLSDQRSGQQSKGKNHHKKEKRQFLRSHNIQNIQPVQEHAPMQEADMYYDIYKVRRQNDDSNYRRLRNDLVRLAVLQRKLKNGGYEEYGRDGNNVNTRRFRNNPVRMSLLQSTVKNGNLYYNTRNNKRNKHNLNIIMNAILRAIKNSNIEKQHFNNRGHDLVTMAAVRPSDINAEHLNYRPLETYLKDSADENSYEIKDGAHEIYSSEEGDYNIYRRSAPPPKSSSEKTGNCSDKDSSSSGSSESAEKNQGNPYTIFKNKYKQNWLWNHFMDGNHMNVNPYGPEFDPLGPSGTQLFFGRKWWYFNQDDFRPFRRR